MTDPADSAVEGVDDAASPTSPKVGRRRASTVSGARNINDLEQEGTEIDVSPDTQKTGWKINTSPATIDDKEMLKKMLTTPAVKKIDLHFPLGLEVTARNLKGVTIKDALDAIHKQYKKKADDELDTPYLAGFEWDKDESWTRLVVHLQKNPGQTMSTGGKKKKKADA